MYGRLEFIFLNIRIQTSGVRIPVGFIFHEIAQAYLPLRGVHNHRLDDYVRGVVKGSEKSQIINWFKGTPLQRFAKRSSLTPLKGGLYRVSNFVSSTSYFIYYVTF